MSLSTMLPTETLPSTYLYSTSQSSSSTFTTPTAIPSNIVPFGPAFNCPSNITNNVSPQGNDTACAISNARETNEHAFWDLYECCKGGNITAFGLPTPCTAQCTIVGDGQTYDELRACVKKRVSGWACQSKPVTEDIEPGNGTESSSATPSASGGAAGSSSASGGAARSSSASGAGSAVGVAHVGGSKVAVLMFGVLAVASFAGMML
jgi:hypothetical protein